MELNHRKNLHYKNSGNNIWNVLSYSYREAFLIENDKYQKEDYTMSEKRTCFMFFSRKKKNVQKELKKLKEKYTKGGSLFLQDVNAEFKFEKPDFE